MPHILTISSYGNRTRGEKKLWIFPFFSKNCLIFSIFLGGFLPEILSYANGTRGEDRGVGG